MGKFRKISTELLPFILVENWFPSSILLIFSQLSSNLVYELIFGRSGLGLKMGKFRQVNAELLPLIYGENWFWCLILGII